MYFPMRMVSLCSKCENRQKFFNNLTLCPNLCSSHLQPFIEFFRCTVSVLEATNLRDSPQRNTFKMRLLHVLVMLLAVVLTANSLTEQPLIRTKRRWGLGRGWRWGGGWGWGRGWLYRLPWRLGWGLGRTGLRMLSRNMFWPGIGFSPFQSWNGFWPTIGGGVMYPYGK
ncbi:hypothetical protein Y032_0087g2068 [Ancylostoma ceylanicum]|nr:hypothetical protein Y032_0087g2068 [Ancylostoma ceylanicum]